MGESLKWSKPKIKTIQKDGEFTKGADRADDMQPSTVQWNELAREQNRVARQSKFGLEIKMDTS